MLAQLDVDPTVNLEDLKDPSSGGEVSGFIVQMPLSSSDGIVIPNLFEEQSIIPDGTQDGQADSRTA